MLLPHDHPRTAYGYVRVSTEMQAKDDHVLQEQADKIRRFCLEHDLNLISIYEDVGSGANPFTMMRRPGLQDVTKRAIQEGACLVVTEPTRLFRNVEAARRWLSDSPVPILSIRDEALLSSQQFLDAVQRGETSAEQIRRGTSSALAEKRAKGQKLGSRANRAAATKASAKARALRSDELVDTIARILLEDPAYRDLSHRAFAELLNRRNILTGWQRPWTGVGVRRHRSRAEELIAEWEARDAEDDAPPVAPSSPVSDEGEDEMAELGTLPNFGMF